MHRPFVLVCHFNHAGSILTTKIESKIGLQLYAMIFAVSMASDEGLSDFSCITCFESLKNDGLGYGMIGDDCKPAFCQPGETRCLVTKFHAPDVGTMRIRACETQEVEDVEDGCIGMGCKREGFGYHCKQACSGANCNDDEFADLVDQVNR